jgi:hypothetical protein
MCGSAYGPPKCVAVKLGNTSPDWTMDLEGNGTLGGALAPGTLYLVTNNGILYALGDEVEENK